jgi:hypothetical protein
MRISNKIVLILLGMGGLLVSSLFANMYPGQFAASGGYGSSYPNGSYSYGQGYQGSSFQTSYYSQGYGGYNQGYQGYYGGGYDSGMGNNFSYVDNNWIEDQLRFAVTDVNQNRPYGAMQKLQGLSGYVQQFGDSELYRRVQLTTRLSYKSSLRDEVNKIYTDWKAGGMRLGWESGANQSYMGQDDISQAYLIAQLQDVIRDIDANKQNRGRQRLLGLQSAIPPRGNDRLVRRVYYASTVNRPSQMKSEVEALIAEIQSGSLILNDTENNPENYYYGSGATNPYSQSDQGYPGGGYTGPGQDQGGFPGGGPRYDQGSYGGGYGGIPGPSTIQYPPGGSVGQPISQPGTIDFQNQGYQPGIPSDSTTPQAASQPVAEPIADLVQLKANVAAAYSKLKIALTEADMEKIKIARDEYAAAQLAFEKAKQ